MADPLHGMSIAVTLILWLFLLDRTISNPGSSVFLVLWMMFSASSAPVQPLVKKYPTGILKLPAEPQSRMQSYDFARLWLSAEIRWSSSWLIPVTTKGVSLFVVLRLQLNVHFIYHQTAYSRLKCSSPLELSLQHTANQGAKSNVTSGCPNVFL